MDIKEKSFNIVNGPSKDSLFDNCKYWHNASSNPLKSRVFFAVVVGYSAPASDPGCAAMVETVTDVNVQGIEHENGSGYSFNIHGYATLDRKAYRFRAYYNAQSRNGRITLLMQ